VSTPPQPDRLGLAAQHLARARGVVVITGAGASGESGIRTFRDTMDGLWKDFDPARLATPEAFAADPALVARWYDHRRLGCLAAEPNPGHLALARLESRVTARGGRFTLLTQNVDRLHQRAGSRNVAELHGSIIEWRCTSTGATLTPPPEPMPVFPPPSPFAPGAMLRPNVVWFGEMLPRAALDAAEAALDACDVFLTVGTSSVVYPAAGFVQLAAHRGAFTIEVNREPSAASSIVDLALRGLSGEILPRLIDAAFPPG
jgi:NAD-dependent deacetylase